MAELVSILIPAFNAGKWIGQAIRSSINQTWPEKEIIIIDDGSTDNTFKIASRYKFRLVKLVSQDHAGASVARNKALFFAQGDYIQWLDSDDLLAPEKIALQMQKVKYHQNSLLLFSCAWADFYSGTYNAKFMPSSLWRDLEPLEWIYRKIADGSWLAPESWLVSRKLTELAGPWDEMLSRDIDGEYFCRVVAACEKVLFIPDAKCYHRIDNPRSISSAFNLTYDKRESILLSINKQNKYLLSLENSDRTRAACLKNLQRCLIYFYPEGQEIFKRACELADELGGKLLPLDLGWKYNWIAKLLGLKSAKYAQRVMALAKALFCRNWDRIIYNLAGHSF